MAMLDCLLSLAEVSASPDFCRPELTSDAQPFISIENGRHPCLAQASRNSNFIPNDVSLGEKVRRSVKNGSPAMANPSSRQ